ncbi:MAG: tail fiber domain-containing protein [Bacteroidia bacterium]|nr:tail fiber domain-containing protein [Bacteroidia bacterium]
MRTRKAFLGIGLLLSSAPLWAQNVGIGTAMPQQRLHVNGKAIVHDGQTGAPMVSAWGSAGSRVILWPGSATTHPYEIGINASTLWYSVPAGAQHSFYHGGNEVFAITPTTRNIVTVGGSINYPSIWLGQLIWQSSSGPYPKRGTLVFFGGPTNNFENNTDAAFMYFVHLGNDITRLRLHVEDNSPNTSPYPDEGFSIMGNSCSNTCNDIAGSQLLFDFVSDGQAYKPGGGPWASLSDLRTKAEVRPYARGLEAVRALRPVSYRYSEKYFPALKDKWYVGLIAQEVQEVAPEMVHPYWLQCPGDRLEEVLAVDPNELTYMLINAVKELDAERERLGQRVDSLEAENAELRALNAELRSVMEALRVRQAAFAAELERLRAVIGLKAEGPAQE